MRIFKSVRDLHREALSCLFLFSGELAAGSSSLIHFLCLCKESDKESTADFDAMAAFDRTFPKPKSAIRS
jgi:hypothetical protein